jgi:pyrimidine nucleoside transport protein
VQQQQQQLFWMLGSNISVTLGWMGDLAGMEGLSFELILGKIFIPVAFIIGVPAADCENVGRLIGLKTIINEFKAYQELGILVANGAISKRAETIATFALCGFANPGSIGIQLGGLGALAPERKKDLAQVVFRAFISGCVASLLNACVAGALVA